MPQIPTYPDATTPLTGAEGLLGVQNGDTVQIPVTDIASYVEEAVSAGAASPDVKGSRSYPLNWAAAIAWAQNLSPMVGFAAVGNTTGGNGQTVYYVVNESDAVIEGPRPFSGSFRYCLAQALANGGGLIVFSPFGTFNIELASPWSLTPTNAAVTLALNITIAAPGFNVNLIGDNTVNKIEILGSNVILRGLNIPGTPGSTGGDRFAYGNGFQAAGASPQAMSPLPNGTATVFTCTLPVAPITAEVGGVIVLSSLGAQIAEDNGAGVIAGTGITGTVNYATGAVSITITSAPSASALPLTVAFSSLEVLVGDGIKFFAAYQIGDSGPLYCPSQLWVDQCSATFQGGDLIDLSSPLIAPGNPPADITVSRCLWRQHDKACLLGSETDYAAGTAPVVRVTWYQNVHEGAAGRNPLVGPLNFVDDVNSINILTPHVRPDGSQGDVYGACTEDASGCLLARGCYALLGYTPGGPQDYPQPNAAYGYLPETTPGVFQNIGSVADGLAFISPDNNVGLMPSLPYTLAALTVPGTQAERWNFLLSIYANAGAGRNPSEYLDYLFVEQAAGDAAGLSSDGWSVLYDGAAGGYRVRLAGDPSEAVNPTGPIIEAELVIPNAGAFTPNGSNVLTIPMGRLYSVGPQSGTAAEITSIVSDGSWTFAVGQVITLIPEAGSTATLLLAGGGNISLSGQSQFIVNGTIELIWSGTVWSVFSSTSNYAANYAPTPTNLSNVASLTINVINYQFNGIVLHCWGNLTMALTAAGLGTFKVPLPPENLTLVFAKEVAGMALSASSTALSGGTVAGDVGAQTADFSIYSASTASLTYTFDFTGTFEQ